MDKKSDTIRELFIEELAEVQGGAPDTAIASLDTTQACCEELIFDKCCL